MIKHVLKNGEMLPKFSEHITKIQDAPTLVSLLRKEENTHDLRNREGGELRTENETVKALELDKNE